MEQNWAVEIIFTVNNDVLSYTLIETEAMHLAKTLMKHTNNEFILQN